MLVNWCIIIIKGPLFSFFDTSLQNTDTVGSFLLSCCFSAASVFKDTLSGWHNMFELVSDQCDLQQIGVCLSKVKLPWSLFNQQTIYFSHKLLD